MTNAEKFEEVFGIKIVDFPVDPCSIFDHEICWTVNDCSKCELKGFWEKQYRERKDK